METRVAPTVPARVDGDDTGAAADAVVCLNSDAGDEHSMDALAETYPLSQHYTKWSRTKIVATVGPACRDVAQLADLVRAGADVFRLNMAHATPDEQQPLVESVRSATI